MQSPLMNFMADDVDLKSAPFTLVLGSGAALIWPETYESSTALAV